MVLAGAARRWCWRSYAPAAPTPTARQATAPSPALWAPAWARGRTSWRTCSSTGCARAPRRAAAGPQTRGRKAACLQRRAAPRRRAAWTAPRAPWRASSRRRTRSSRPSWTRWPRPAPPSPTCPSSGTRSRSCPATPLVRPRWRAAPPRPSRACSVGRTLQSPSASPRARSHQAGGRQLFQLRPLAQGRPQLPGPGVGPQRGSELHGRQPELKCALSCSARAPPPAASAGPSACPVCAAQLTRARGRSLLQLRAVPHQPGSDRRGGHGRGCGPAEAAAAHLPWRVPPWRASDARAAGQVSTSCPRSSTSPSVALKCCPSA